MGTVQKITWKDHEEWLAIRHKHIGGSDAGAVIGMNPYKSAYTLWAEKTDQIPEFEGNLTTKVGAYLEDLVGKLFEEETGKKVHRVNATMVNSDYPFACANVDRVVQGEKAFLEIKTTTSIPTIRQLKGTEFPDMYYAQVVHYLAVTGFEKAYLAVLINCRELKVYELLRDEDEINALMEAEKHFWTLVETKTPPAVDGSDSTSESIATIYPNSNGEKMDLFGVSDVLEEYARLKVKIDDLTTQMDEKKNSIKEYMQEFESGEFGRFKVSYKTRAGRKSFDDKRFAKEHKDIDLAPYYKEMAGSRPLTITIKKEEEI